MGNNTPTLRARIRGGDQVTGLFIGLPTPASVEITGAAGPDFLCLDGEHSALRGELLAGMLRAAELTGVPAIVRVPEGQPWLIAEVLDAGAEGVLVPRVSTADQARAAVAAARFPPEGRRGAGPGRAAGYGYGVLEYVERAREETFVAVQIETIEAIAALDEILAVPGIDLVFIGPGDLGVCLAAAGRKMPQALLTEVAGIFARAKAAGVPAGIFLPGAADPNGWAESAQLLIRGNDSMILQQGAAALFAAKRPK